MVFSIYGKRPGDGRFSWLDVYKRQAYNNVQVIGGKRTERMVFTLPKFTLADDKQLRCV